MDRTALLHRAAEVRRRIFASLPWEVRLAAVFVSIANETGYLDALGRQLGVEFLRAGITGMPDAGPKFKPESPHAQATLPKNYMGKFIHDVYGLLISSFHDPDLAEVALVTYIGKLADGTIKLKPVPLSPTAESFVRHGIMLEAKTIARKALRERARSESLQDGGEDDEGKEMSRDIEDPNALLDFQRVLSPHMWQEWMAYLAQHVHPDIPLYLKLRMEGYTNEEILGVPKENIPSKLPHWKSSPQNWKNYGPKIRDKSKEFWKNHGDELPVAV